MNSFFEADLFECRDRVLRVLETRGLMRFQHFESVDPLLQESGLEVCAIRLEKDARSILDLLRRLFPNWRYGSLQRDEDSGTGWRVVLQQKPSWRPGGSLL